MSAEWPVQSVSALQESGVLHVEDGNHGEYRPRPSDFQAQGTAFIRATDIDWSGRIHFESASRISDKAVERIRKGKARPGDILFSHKGTVGKLAVAPADSPPFVCSPQTTFWRTLDTQQLHRGFLYSFMRSRGFRDQWFARKGETDMADYVSLTAQRTFLVPLPPIEEQRAIANVLGALDAKIEANRKLNETLEATCQALFRSWFVDFDPVVAKSERRRPPHLSPDVVALFPSRLQETENGPLPEGWLLSEIGKEVRVVGGSTPSTRIPEFWSGDIAWITPKDLSGATSPVVLETARTITPAGLKKISSGLLPPQRTVLLSSRAPIGYLALPHVPLAVNQGFIAMVCEKVLPPHFVFFWTAANMEEVLSRAGGTTFAEISKTSFRPIPVLVPATPVLQHFEKVASASFQQIAANEREAQTLAALRDALLPRLLSGELRVRQAEKLVEEAI